MNNRESSAESLALSQDIRRAAAGDRAALRRVYDNTSAKLYSICLHILRDGDLSEDALQQVYLKVWQRAADFDPARASPITWLCVIARNTAIDWQRAMRRHGDAVDAAAVLQALGEQAHASDREDTATLHRCMDELERGRRDYIHLAFFQGFTYSELAQQAVVPLGTVKSWIRRALIQLRECMELG